MVRNEMEDRITSYTASAMFGPKGPECHRTGHGHLPRTLGLGWLIYAFVRVVEPEVVLEIGSGGSTFCILNALLHNGKGHLYEITYDPEIGTETLFDHGFSRDDPRWYHKDGRTMSLHEANLMKAIEGQGFKDMITIYFEKSKDMLDKWDKPIDMLVVDGDHSAEGLKTDWEYAKWLPPGGYALFHDFTACAHEIGIYLQSKVGDDTEWAMIVEPDHLSLAMMQRKFTFKFGPGRFDSALNTHDNPQLVTKTFNVLASRECGFLEEWKGYWIPPPGALKGIDKYRTAGAEFLKSGKLQNVENIKKAIKEVEDGI